MQVNAPTTHSVNLKAISVKAGVRYWEDAEVNGHADLDGSRIPLRVGAYWQPVIELEGGRILNWPAGTIASIHYKVCDDGEYALLDSQGKALAVRKGYVPDMLAVGEDGEGDYIILEVGSDGQIQDWQPPHIDPDSWTWVP